MVEPLLPDLFARRALYAARHGKHREARAWAIAKLMLAANMLAKATARRERAERAFRRAVEDEGRILQPRPLALPRGLSVGRRADSGHIPEESPPVWGEWTWRALGRVAAFGQDEARAVERCKRLAIAIWEERTEVLDDDRRTEWEWNESEIPF